MKQAFRNLILAGFGLWGLVAGLYAQDIPAEMNPLDTMANRTLGSQIFQLDLGMMFPLFTYTTVDPIETISATNLNLGGAGHIRWSAFFDDTFAIGFDIGGSVSTGPNDGVFANLLLGPRLSAIIREGIFQFPFSITPALSLIGYDGGTYVGFGLRPEAGMYVDLDSKWALGLNVGYNWIPEVYADNSTIPESEERVGNLLETTLSIMYSF